MRKAVIVGVIAALLLGAALPVQAATVPYASFLQTETSAELPSPVTFEVETVHSGITLGGDEWDTPQDMVFDKEGNLYLLDSRNDRILIYDAALKPVGEIETVKQKDGTEEYMGRPQSLFVSDEGYIYVADTNNERCLKLDREGNILREYRKPEDESYTSEVFYPIKLVLNKSDGMLYVISQNVYQGIILFTEEGEFSGYYGSPPVAVSAKLLLDRFWKGIMTREMREGLADYVPVEYTSLATDADGFIYAVSSYTESGTEQLRRLNYLGSNILPNKENLGEQEVIYYRSEILNSQFCDVCVAGENIAVLDARFQRCYLFDMRGNRLLTFGTEGAQKGAFLRAAAVEYRDGRFYVLDATKNNLTVYVPTAYGEKILTASHYDASGDYDEAMVYWEQVLEENANCEMAYTGLGEAMLKNGAYKQAVEYFRLSNNKERESVAFGYYRAQVLRENMGWLIVLILLLLVGLFLFTNRGFAAFVRRRLCKGNEDTPKKERAWRWAVQVMMHPLETFNELKHKRYQNVSFVGVILLLWTVVYILVRQFTGFRFSTYDPASFNLPVEIATAVLPFVLVAAVNWAVCAIMDGEGKFWEISTYLAFAMVPYMIFSLAGMLLSRVLVLDEGLFLTVVQWIGILWSGLLIFHGQRFVHNYNTGKTIGTAALTVAGVLIVLIILLLAFSLVLQLTNFISSIYTELSLRK